MHLTPSPAGMASLHRLMHKLHPPHRPVLLPCSKSERVEVLISDIALAAVMYGLALLGRSFGWGWLVCTYGIPLLIVNGWLVLITLLQHSHPGVVVFKIVQVKGWWDSRLAHAAHFVLALSMHAMHELNPFIGTREVCACPSQLQQTSGAGGGMCRHGSVGMYASSAFCCGGCRIAMNSCMFRWGRGDQVEWKVGEEISGEWQGLNGFRNVQVAAWGPQGIQRHHYHQHRQQMQKTLAPPPPPQRKE